jgi:hypothetical protein
VRVKPLSSYRLLTSMLLLQSTEALSDSETAQASALVVRVEISDAKERAHFTSQPARERAEVSCSEATFESRKILRWGQLMKKRSSTRISTCLYRLLPHSLPLCWLLPWSKAVVDGTDAKVWSSSIRLRLKLS